MNPEPELFFSEPRLKMTVGGRMLVRILGAVSNILVAAAGLMGVLSDVTWVRWTALFLLLFILDRFFHRKEGDAPIPLVLKRKRANLAGALSPAVIGPLERAYDRSSLNRTDIAVELARSFLSEKEVEEGLARLDANVAEVKKQFEELAKAEAASSANDEERLNSLEKILTAAFWMAEENGHRFIGAVDIFSVLPKTSNALLQRLFGAYSIEDGDLERALLFSSARKQALFAGLPKQLGGFAFERDRRLRHRVVNRAWTSRVTPTLDSFGTDWSDLARAREGGFMIGHADEYDHLVNVLARENNPNAILVGEEGAGKETVVAHLAAMIEKDEVPPALFDKRLVSLDIARLVSGSSTADLQSRLQKIVEEIVVAGNVILFVPDIHHLVKTSGDYLSAADTLMPILRNNAFPIVGTTYPAEYKQFIAPRSDFGSMFETVEIKELSLDDSERTLVYEAILLEEEFGVAITFGAIKTAVGIAKRYFRDRLLPGSAIDLLTSAATSVGKEKVKIVDHETVIRIAESRVNVPLHEATAEEDSKLLDLEKTIHSRVIGQEEAVKVVSDALREYRSGLARKGGPIASFLFVGPTGVGKTELAKTLAAIQFNSETAMVRFDMTEYQTAESMARFIGSSNGEISGALTEAIKKRPFSLVLLDEFEKAHPNILDLFLQVLDDGRLTDSLGKTVNFENTIIIATSNAHSDLINEALSKGETMEAMDDYLKRRLTDVFKPELLNRFSKIVIFRELEMPEVAVIAKLELKKLADSISERGLSLEFSEGVAEKIAKLGYEPAFGARPLRRTIDENIKAPLAEFLLEKRPTRGTKIVVSPSDSKDPFEFSTK